MPHPFTSIYSHGFIRAAVGVPLLRVADPAYNVERTIGLARRASDEGAAVALEAVCADAGLAGRALLFSTRFATLPRTAPVLSTLHLLHGAADGVAPVDQARQVHGHLAELGGDATLDMASNVGHELHDALIRQAIARLQTYLPQRSWEAVMGAPDMRVDEYDADDGASDADTGDGGTLH